MEIEELFAKNWQFANATQGLSTEEHDPRLVTVSCCDARVPQNSIFGSAPGENFTVAKIGNCVSERDENGDPILSGSVLYPLVKTAPEYAIVIGHTDCGAVTAAYGQVAENAEPESHELQNELDLLLPIVREGLELFDRETLSRDEQITRLVEYNVDKQVEALLPKAGDVPVLGVVVDLHGYYPGRPGQAHLVNHGGVRKHGDVPSKLKPNFYRKLDY